MKKLNFIFLLFFSSMLFGQVPTDGLVADWAFTDGKKTDNIGSLNSTFSSTSVTMITDRHGANNAVSVPKGQFIDFGNQFTSVLSGTSAKFTISLWVKPITFQGTAQQAILTKAFFTNGGSRSFALLLNPTTSTVQFQLFGTSTGNDFVRVNGNTPLTKNGAWNHIVISIDMSVLSKNQTTLQGFQMYVNNQLQQLSIAESKNQKFTYGMAPSTARIALGTYLNSSGVKDAATQDMGLHFDDFKIYNRTLSAQEVAALYNEEGCKAAEITEQPVSNVTCQDGAKTLKVKTDESNVVYQWMKKGVGGAFQSTGTNADSLVVSGNGEYRVELVNACGSRTISNEVSAMFGGPVITKDLQNSDNFICQNKTTKRLEIEAIGEGLTYQWKAGLQLNNYQDIPNETNSYTEASQNNTYYVVDVTACGITKTSTYAYVRNWAFNPLSVTITNTKTSLCQGIEETFSSTGNYPNGTSILWSTGEKTFNTAKHVIDRDTTISVTVSLYGCSVTDSKSFTVIVNPKPIITQNGKTLEVVNEVYDSFQWFENEVNKGIVVKTYSTPINGNSYYVTATKGPCTLKSEPFVYDELTAIDAIQTNDVVFYPNPVQEEIYLNESSVWSILSLDGKIILSGNGNVIAVQELNAGIYLLKLENSIYRIVKQ